MKQLQKAFLIKKIREKPNKIQQSINKIEGGGLPFIFMEG